MTKQFTAMGILILQSQGKLSVQDPICDHILDCPKEWQDITIHHLLTHTSGLSGQHSDQLYQEIEHGTSGREPAYYLGLTSPWSLDSQPGEHYAYNNFGYILLAHIIEQASGQSYADFLKQTIFTPLNMHNRGYQDSTSGVAGISTDRDDTTAVQSLGRRPSRRAQDICTPLAKIPESPAQWRALGQGEMRWLGFRLDDATLWVSGERYQDSSPFALHLRYAREISRDRLVSSSITEMRRLGWREEAQLRRWESALESIFPDVAAGHVIVGVSLPGRGAAFFHDGRPGGEVADPEFARAFFAIWLDARTRDPELRARLLQES